MPCIKTWIEQKLCAEGLMLKGFSYRCSRRMFSPLGNVYIMQLAFLSHGVGGFPCLVLRVFFWQSPAFSVSEEIVTEKRQTSASICIRYNFIPTLSLIQVWLITLCEVKTATL